MVLESAVKRQVAKALSEHWPRVYFVKQTSDQPSGTPDLMVCYRGRFIAMELKRPGGNPTTLQQWRMAQIREAGGIALSVSSKDAALFALTEVDREIDGS